MKKLILTTLLVFLSLACFAQNTFFKTYDCPTGTDCANTFQELLISATNTIYNVGDNHFIKSNENGDVTWDIEFDSGTYLYDINETATGELLVSGLYASGNTSIRLGKIQDNKTIIWNKLYPLNNYSILSTIGLIVKDNNYIIGVYALDASSQKQLILLTINSAGTLINQTEVTGITSAGTYSKIIADNDSFYIVGYGANSYDGLIIKLDDAFNFLWEKTFTKTTDLYAGTYFNDIYPTFDGGFIVAGAVGSLALNPYKMDLLLLKVDQDGIEEWSEQIDFNGTDYAYSVKQTADQGFIVTGYSGTKVLAASDKKNKAFLLKTDATGTTEWVKAYGKEGENQNSYAVAVNTNYFIACGSGPALFKTDFNGFIQTNIPDHLDHTNPIPHTVNAFKEQTGVGIAEMENGNFFTAGSYFNSDLGFLNPYWAIITPTGAVSWSNSEIVNEEMHVTAMKANDDNAYYVVGNGNAGSGGSDLVFVYKLDDSGNVIWEYSDYLQDNAIYDVVPTSDGGCLLAGTAQNSSGSSIDYDVFVVKINHSGNFSWSELYGETNTWETAYSIIETEDGNFFLTGESLTAFDTPKEALVLKINASGIQQWYNTLSEGIIDEIHAVSLTHDNQYLLAGSTRTAGNQKLLAMKVDDIDGSPVWSKTYDLYDEEKAHTIIKTLDNDFIIGGTLSHDNANVYEQFAFLMKISETGTQKWLKTYGEESIRSTGHAMVLTSNETVAMIGTHEPEWGYLQPQIIISDLDTLATNDPDLEDNILLLHPNPTSNRFKIKSSEAIEHIDVFDATGRLITSIKDYQPGQHIEISNFTKGIYYIVINNKNTKALIKN